MAGTFQVLLSLLFMLSTAAGLSFKDFGMDQIDESCSRPIPSGPQKGKSYEERLVLAFSDARQIARETFLGNFQQSKAFTRYFQSQDYPQARRMFLQIVDSFTDSSQDRIQVACGDDKIPECKPFGPTAPLGFLEAQVSTAPYTIPPTGPSDNTLRFCDSFFDGKIPFLARNLEDQRFNQDGWCKGSGWSTAFDFRVPGVEIISLLTHLDRGSAPPINEYVFFRIQNSLHLTNLWYDPGLTHHMLRLQCHIIHLPDVPQSMQIGVRGVVSPILSVVSSEEFPRLRISS